MAEVAEQTKIALAAFSCFTWQCDVVQEITAHEAEAFFNSLEKTQAAAEVEAARIGLHDHYTKNWRDYLKHGPVPATELSLLSHQLDAPAREWVKSILDATFAAAPTRKRKAVQKMHNLLIDLVHGNDGVLPAIQNLYRESRFFAERPAAEPAPADSVTAPAAAHIELPKTEKPPEVTHTPVAEVVVGPSVSAAAPAPAAETAFSVMKLVPFSEHDAVSPEKLQFWTKGPKAMRCIGIVDRSHDFKSFQFMAEEPTLFFYKPGQFVTLELNIEGKRVLRSYTISSSPSRPHLIEISVKRVKGGLVSNYLHDHLNLGDTVTMKPPGGKFHCFDTTTDKYLFLAAGSGVTPMLSMARWWHDTGVYPDVIFYHGIREPEDAVFTEDMMMFTSANRKFKYVAAFTSPHLPQEWPGMKGRLSEEHLKQIAPDLHDRMVFTCGPDSFMKHAKLLLERQGFPIKERFRQESFGAPPAAKAAAAAKAAPAATGTAAPAVQPRPAETAAGATVHFSLAGLEIFGGDMDIPILDLAEEVGVEIPSSCRAGTCGTCRAMKIKGEVECDETSGLSDADREAGFILTCVSRAKTYVEIEV
ncbi:hybrid-cluster NAD(P)-dependent oxidoreductase [Turneriella parva]|uniref:Oxidoreductase FAD-binding domain protein n=1 Tax=Turneriella parva (strain ATCC BAA-1111 / DSM 21527 / NCTC 11395 / H) TaxID=869212 RepID=I4B3H4_TURPD|nr:hybrid-cluster NAD(P)-dependent oxidoreductase [Turneriella parva]AFM11831.1 Oxidoreductase FAD-binding domain protein [Turneriella parva DSM 21527]